MSDPTTPSSTAVALCLALDTEGFDVVTETLTCKCGDEGADVEVSLRNVLDTDEERELARAGAHLVVESELLRLGYTVGRIRVLVPLSKAGSAYLYRRPTQPPPTPTCVEWCMGQGRQMDAFLFQCLETLGTALYHHVIDAYPWRDGSLMRAAVPRLVQEACDRMARREDEPLLLGNVDAILPPLAPAMTSVERFAVMSDLHTYLGRMPITGLEVYETLYAVMADHERSLCLSTRALFHAVFVL